MATIGSVALAAMPKCPACLMVYAGFLGGLTPGRWWDAYPSIVAVGLGGGLTACVAALAWRARERRGYGPAALALLGAITLLVGKFSLDSPQAIGAALAALLGAAFWEARRLRAHPGSPCPHCSPGAVRRAVPFPRFAKYGG